LRIARKCDRWCIRFRRSAQRAPLSAGADLLMPVFSDEEVHGALRLAPKSNGQEYDPEDLKFLIALGNKSASPRIIFACAMSVRSRSTRATSNRACCRARFRKLAAS